MTTTPAPTDLLAYQAWLEESLDTQAAADFLGLEPKWMAHVRCYGGGPRYRRLTRRTIVYTRRDLLEWRDSKSYGSTAEYRNQRLPGAAEGASESPDWPEVGE